MIDNYDSFTYNLVQYIEEILDEVVPVIRNDEIDFEWAQQFDSFVLSPGPGLPNEAGSLKDFIQRFARSKSMLGVCLGMQAIAECFGGHLSNLDRVYHGVATPITIINNSTTLFHDIPKRLYVGRYHSWVVDKTGFPCELTITSEDEKGDIMSLQHCSLPVFAVQFHPESILTEYGKNIIFNFLKTVGAV